MAAIAHVGVVGAGLAGLATALAAARAGLRVDLFETQSERSWPGSHIDVVPNMLRDLAALGLADACVRQGFPYQGVAVRDGEGRTHFEVPTPHLAGAQWPASVGMVYGDLLEILHAAAVAHGVVLHAGRQVVDANDAGSLLMADGSRVAVDLAVLACGEPAPAVAGTSLPAVPAEALHQRWCHFLLPRPRSLDRTAWVIGLGALRAQMVPVDTARAGVALQMPAEVAVTPARLRQVLSLQGALLKALAPYLHDDTPVHVRTVQPGVLAGDWHHQGVLRVGSSAHRLAPHFGQSAAQSLEDACVLGELLGAGLTRESLLPAFMARRGERARRIHSLTAQAARWQLCPEASTDLHRLMQELAPTLAKPA